MVRCSNEQHQSQLALCASISLGHVFYIFRSSDSNEYAGTISVKRPTRVFVLKTSHRLCVALSLFRQIISLVLGDLQFNFYHRWFDCIFLLSALFSIGILYLHYRSSQQSLSLYDKNVQKVSLHLTITLQQHMFVLLGLLLTMLTFLHPSMCVCVL